jgi:hypothetical protein
MVRSEHTPGEQVLGEAEQHGKGRVVFVSMFDPSPYYSAGEKSECPFNGQRRVL